jgi:imidazolonepropionase-like amidohydrolase/ABC-type multidrug transport system permease subunit
VKPFLSFLKIDLKLASRNRAVLFFNYIFPLIFFFAFTTMFGARQAGQVVLVVTMVTVIGILGSGFFGAGMRAVQEREENILRRYKVMPITPVPLLLAAIVAGVILYLPSVILLLFLAHQIYGMAIPSNLFSLFVFVCLSAASFRSLGLIIASVVNSMQESNIITQVIYMPMLFLSGATFPLSMMPSWLQVITQFIPATYLVTGISAILQRGESVGQNFKPAAALLVTMVVALFIATKLFRWEKEERIRTVAKLWVLVVLLPFFLLGIYEAHSRQQLSKSKMLARDRERGRITLIQNARIFVGNGDVIESGAILVRKGKIAQIYNSQPDPRSLGAEPLDAAGKTVLPGLIDIHVHLGGTGGFLDDWSKFDPNEFVERALEAYLYCGITAVRSVGDQLDVMLRLRQAFGSGEKLGSELFFCGPLFTAEGGHGTEYANYLPPPLQARFTAQFVRTPKNSDEARQQVDELASQHVDAIKGVLEQGVPGYPFNRMDINVLRAVVEEAHAKKLPVAIHCGNAADVLDAIALSADSIEHGSFVDEIPDAAFADMKAKGIAYDPTLSVVEGLTNFARGDTSLLSRSLVQQVTSRDLLVGTEHAATDKASKLREGLSHHPMSLAIGNNNLLKALRAGVTLVTGSDAGNPMVMHGPTVQHELQLWVAAGIPADQALRAATLNSAKLLRADNRIGTIEPGKEGSLLIVDGNPLQDIHALSSISFVMMKGEWVARRQIFEQK